MDWEAASETANDVHDLFLVGFTIGPLHCIFEIPGRRFQENEILGQSQGVLRTHILGIVVNDDTFNSRYGFRSLARYMNIHRKGRRVVHGNCDS